MKKQITPQDMYDIIANQAIKRENTSPFKGTPEFINFANSIVEEFNEHYGEILNDAKKIGNYNNIEVIDVDLYGSYATGKATENSDIDILITYKGDLDPYAAADLFRGEFSSSIGGLYDIVAKKVD